MGELGKVYEAADLVFVGGSLVPRGGQNMMEPAALGRTVLFGPHVHNFREDAEALLAAGAALQVASAEALPDALSGLLADPGEARAMGTRARSQVSGRRGATAATLEVLEDAFLKGLGSDGPPGSPEKG